MQARTPPALGRWCSDGVQGTGLDPGPHPGTGKALWLQCRGISLGEGFAARPAWELSTLPLLLLLPLKLDPQGVQMAHLWC